MPYFEFRQNNSGGHFVIDRKRGLGPEVWILANTPDEADMKALGIGIYLDGAGDCECCGARWSNASDWNVKDSVEPNSYSFYNHDEIYVHEGDGFRIIAKPE